MVRAHVLHSEDEPDARCFWILEGGLLVPVLQREQVGDERVGVAVGDQALPGGHGERRVCS